MVSYQLESDVEVSPRPTRGINVVAMASMSQTQFQKEYKKFEVRCRVLTRFMFEVNVVAMVSMSQTQISL